jgi:hypothetical protein
VTDPVDENTIFGIVDTLVFDVLDGLASLEPTPAVCARLQEEFVAEHKRHFKRVPLFRWNWADWIKRAKGEVHGSGDQGN